MADRRTKFLIALLLIAAFGFCASELPAQQAGGAAAPVRPVGVVAEIQTGKLTLKTDAGPTLAVEIPDGVTAMRIPPGAKDLKSATKISVSDISVGDRVFIKGRISDDQKSLVATSILVMNKAELTAAHEEEAAEWQKRGINGVVKEVNAAGKELTLAVRNVPPTPGNLTRPVVLTFPSNAALLRYAPDSVKFSDAKPGTFDEIKVGDQVRALGTKSGDGTHFAAEKLVSGTFRNIAATVISADVSAGTVTVKDLANGKPLVVRTNVDSKLHTLPQMVAMMIARFNSGQMGPGGPGSGGAGGQGGAGQGAAGGGQFRRSGGGGGFGGQGGAGSGAPRDFNQMLDRMPPLALGDLKPGQALIVVSTEGAKPSEVVAIALLAGVEPILEARPKGSNEVVLGPWNMTMGGGGEEGAQ